MTSEQGRRGGLTRREAMARALRAGAYAAPVVLSASALTGHVGAATPPPGPVIACGTTGLTFVQDFFLLNVAPGAAFDLFVQPNTAPAPVLVGTFAADAEGVLLHAISLPAAGVPIPFGTTSVTTSVNVAGTGTPAAGFVSTIVGSLACTSGATLPVSTLTPQAFAKIVQEQTGCPAGSTTVWSELVDVNIVNANPSASYDVYILANNAVGGAYVLAGTVATNTQGNGGAVLTTPVTTTGGAPTGVTVKVVPSGSARTVAGALTAAAAPTGNPLTSSLFTVSCAGAVISLSVPKPLLVGVR